MKKVIFYLLLIFVSFCGQAQNKVDSLTQLVNLTKGQEKAKVYLELSDELKFSDPNKAREFVQLGIEQCKRYDLKALKPRFLLSSSRLNIIQSNYKEAIVECEKAIIDFKKINDADGIAKAYNNIGLAEERLGDYVKAKEVYDKAIVLYQTLDDSKGVLFVKGNIANLAYRKGDYDTAIKVYQEILEYALKKDSKQLIASYYGNIGRALTQKGEFPEALKNFYKALPIMDSNNNRSAILKIHNSIGILFTNLEMYDFAIENYEKGLALTDSVSNEAHSGMIHTNLSDLYVNKGEYNKADYHIQKALKIYEGKGIKSNGILLLCKAAIHLKREQYDSTEIVLNEAIALGEKLKQDNILASSFATFGRMYFKKNQLLQAKSYLLKAEVLNEKTGDIKGLNSVVNILSETYKLLGDEEKAWKYKERNSALLDSLFGLDKMNQIMRLEMEKERGVFIQENPELSLTNSTESTQTYVWILLFVIGCIGLTAIVWLLKKQNKEKQLSATFRKVTEENEIIKESLNKKNLEVTFLSLDKAQKDDFLNKLKFELEKFALKAPENKEVRELIKSVHFQDTGKKDWESFKEAYKQVFPLFFDKLLADYPNLSTKELRHCALIRLNIPLEEISEILGISISSVHKARHRLRVKFELQRSEKITSFLSNY